jgi:ABC-type phosphate transport system auxiliary subunit
VSTIEELQSTVIELQGEVRRLQKMTSWSTGDLHRELAELRADKVTLRTLVCHAQAESRDLQRELSTCRDELVALRNELGRKG